MNARYFRARFQTSAATLGDCPRSEAEVAFAGRSNAGKSSAINAITRNGRLARTSKTPGRTQLINFFVLDPARYLVDLPGYGYAKVSRSRQQAWQRSLGEYLCYREPLCGLVSVMDIRHPLTDSDWQLIELQQGGHAALHVLLTKSDKLSRNQMRNRLESVRRQLSEAGVEATLQDFSAVDGHGVDDVHEVLDHWLYNKPLSC